MQAKSMQQYDLPRHNRHFTPSAFGEDTFARELVRQGQINMIEVPFRHPRARRPECRAHDGVTAIPNHKW